MDCCDLGMGDMNPMMFLMMMDGGSTNKEDMFMWMMMSQNGGFQLPGMGNMNPIMMMAMMKDSGGDMFEKMWMMSMMQNGCNFFDMFQPKETQTPAPTRKTRSDKGTKKTKPVVQEPADQGYETEHADEQ